MARESCIVHPPKQAMAIVRQDYYELTGRDACAAALLNIFEYWANGAIASNSSTDERPWVGARPIREFEQMLLGISTDKQIRKRLLRLETLGYIQTKLPTRRGAAKTYRVMVPEIQRALVGQMTSEESALRLFDQQSFGQITPQITNENCLPRSFDQQPFGQMTDTSSVKQPVLLRSNDPALKKKSQEHKKERFKEEHETVILNLSCSDRAADRQSCLKPRQIVAPIQVGQVQYKQPPETIDFVELWQRDPDLARSQLRAIAPGHKRIEIVAHGLGQWWIGPGLNDFDEWLIKACQQRKRKFQQPDSISDAKTFINNMIRNGDWANFALRCEEAAGLRNRLVSLSGAKAIADLPRSPFAISDRERRESALGLARFKVSKGQIEAARAISRQFNILLSEIGLVEGAHASQPELKAA